MLQVADSRLPNLFQLEKERALTFLPTSGNPAAWADRLCGLQMPEFHLLDGEAPPITRSRQEIAARINRRDRCQAFVTHHRSLENYLHPLAIEEVSGLKISYGDTDNVPALVAEGMYNALLPTTPWPKLSVRARQHACERAKQWLNRSAVEAMTPERLAERDPAGEVLGWLQAIAALLKQD